MKKILFGLLALSSLSLASCESAQVTDGRVLYHQYFQKILIDPSSFTVTDEDYTAQGDSVMWQISYSAKNQMGDVILESKAFTTYPAHIHIDGHLVDRHELK